MVGLLELDGQSNVIFFFLCSLFCINCSPPPTCYLLSLIDCVSLHSDPQILQPCDDPGLRGHVMRHLFHKLFYVDLMVKDFFHPPLSFLEFLVVYRKLFITDLLSYSFASETRSCTSSPHSVRLTVCTTRTCADASHTLKILLFFIFDLFVFNSQVLTMHPFF